MKKEIEKDLSEDVLDENDLIINPANISRIARGFIPKKNIVKDHEVQMAKSDLYQAAKNSVRIFELIKDKSEDEGIEGWVQEKIIKAADYLNTVREYLEGEQIQEGPVADLVTNTGMDPGKAFYTVQLDKILEPAPSTSSEKTEESMDGVAPSTRMFASESKKSKSNTCESCGQKWKFSHLCENEDDSSLEEGKTGSGLWANIRARKASGKPMRKKGQKGAPSEEALKAARKGSTNEEQEMTEEKDACYRKVKSRYKVWPSAYASGALVKCRKVGAKNWGNKSKK